MECRHLWAWGHPLGRRWGLAPCILASRAKRPSTKTVVQSLAQIQLSDTWTSWYWDICAGTFKLKLEFTEEYPNKAPVVKFLSKIFHPNSERTSTCFAAGLPSMLLLRSHCDRLKYQQIISLMTVATIKTLLPKFWLSSGPLSFCDHDMQCAVYNDGAICLDILQNQWSPIYDVAAILTSIQVPKHGQDRSCLCRCSVCTSGTISEMACCPELCTLLTPFLSGLRTVELADHSPIATIGFTSSCFCSNKLFESLALALCSRCCRIPTQIRRQTMKRLGYMVKTGLTLNLPELLGNCGQRLIIIDRDSSRSCLVPHRLWTTERHCVHALQWARWHQAGKRRWWCTNCCKNLVQEGVQQASHRGCGEHVERLRGIECIPRQGSGHNSCARQQAAYMWQAKADSVAIARI